MLAMCSDTVVVNAALLMVFAVCLMAWLVCISTSPSSEEAEVEAIAVPFTTDRGDGDKDQISKALLLAL